MKITLLLPKLRKKFRHFLLRQHKVIVGGVIVIPFASLVVAIVLAFRMGYIDPISLGLMLMFWVITGLGITIVYHRYLTHKGFIIRNEFVKKCFIGVAMMGLEGSPLFWCATHRKHHAHADDEGDPHSPLDGYWHAHMGWMFNPDPVEKRRVKDLLLDPTIVKMDKRFKYFALASLLVQPILGIVPHGLWFGWSLSNFFFYFFLDFLWGMVRIFMVHHWTWSINSACHTWGKRPLKVNDQSTNIALIAVPTFGESFHHNHHGCQRSPCHGFLKGQFDISWQVIKLLARLGLIEGERKHLPSEEWIRKNLKSASNLPS